MSLFIVSFPRFSSLVTINALQNSPYCFFAVKSDYFINFLSITIFKNALNTPFFISYPVNFSTLVSQNNAGLNFDKSGCFVSSFSIK